MARSGGWHPARLLLARTEHGEVPTERKGLALQRGVPRSALPIESGWTARSAASMELVEIARIAVNETDKAKIRGAVDIKVPFVVCPEAIVESPACPSSIDRGSGFSGPTLHDSSQAEA